ncbi:MAG: sugar phosphate isomerase/epimerase family protein [Pseudomonadales bacterium]
MTDMSSTTAPRDPQTIMLSAGTIPKATFKQRVSAASEAGFGAISLFPEHYLNALKREKLTVSNMQEILAAKAVLLDEVDPLLDWFGPPDRGASRSESLLYEIADAFGATTMNVAPGLAPALSQAEVTDAFGRVCERAGRHGLLATLEFLPWSVVPNLSTALQIAYDCAQPNARVMLDTWHFFRSKGQVADLFKLSAAQVALISSVQINDAPTRRRPYTHEEQKMVRNGMLSMGWNSMRVMGFVNMVKLSTKTKHPGADANELAKDACFARLMPGAGNIPLAEILSALYAQGATPKIGLEIFSLSTLPANEVAQQAMQAYRSTAADVVFQ